MRSVLSIYIGFTFNERKTGHVFANAIVL